MSNIKNNVRLIGRVGQAPEVRVLSEDKRVVKFSLAVNEYTKNDQGEKVKNTQWHNVVAWGHMALLAEKMLVKGKEIALEGSLNNRKCTNKEGVIKYITEIVASDLTLTGRLA